MPTDDQVVDAQVTDKGDTQVADKSTTDADKGSEGDKGATDKGTTDKGAEGDKGTDKGGDKGTDKGGEKGDGKAKTTIAAGAEGEAVADKGKKGEGDKKAEGDKAPTDAEQWEKLREKMAKHYAAGDEKKLKKEMDRLSKLAGPEAVWGMYRELEAKITSGGMIKIPGKDAKPEEVAAYHKAIGVPEKAEDYIKEIKLDNGAVIGEADKPMLASVTAELHKAGAPPAVVSTMVNWYYKQQEEAAAALDEADETFRVEAERALKDELGPAYKRNVNAIATLFATAPGGADPKNPNSLMSRILGGRTSDGRLIGNDPDAARLLIGLVREINPTATVTEDGHQGGKSIDTEIAEIEGIMRTDRRLYNEKYAPRYAELLGAREKDRARRSA